MTSEEGSVTHDPSSFRSILVPLDGSPFAEQAVPLAARTAQRAGSKLRLILVHGLPSAPIDLVTAKLFTSIELATRKSERAYLRGIQTRLRDGGTRLASAVTLTGKAGPALAQYVREMGIDLVVMSTHGRGGIRRAWLGSVADYLIRTLEVPVLLLRPVESEPGSARPAASGPILVPLDGSPLAEEALGPAIALARAWDAELALLQVVRPVLLSADPALPLPLPSAFDQDLTTMWRTQAQDYIDGIVEQLHGQGIRATGAASLGWYPADSILEAARPERVAAIVIATHGRGGLSRLALGSVTDKVVRGADVPVLACRPAGRGAAKKRSPGQAGSRGRRAAQGGKR
jgi:nucleotide-binding universal stress UspA family protein